MKLLNQYRGLRREIYILFFGRIVTNLGSMIWPVMTMILNRKLGFSAAEISYFFVGSGLIMLPATLIGGKLADRFNKKWMIVACDSVSILCFFISAAIPLGIGTILLFVVAGVFQSIEYPAYDALFADLSTTKDRERAYSLMYLGGNLGLVLSPTIAGLLFKDYLWLSFLISGVSIACSTALIAFLIQDISPVEDTGEEAAYQEKKEGASAFAVLRENPLLILYLLCGTLYSAAYGQYSFIMPLDMATVHGDAGAVIFGTASSLNCITVVVFTPIITRVFAKMRETGKMVTGRSSRRMVAAAAAILNGIKYLAGMDDDTLLIAPDVLSSIQKLNTEALSSDKTSLNCEEILIALTISSTRNPSAKEAAEKLTSLSGCRAHCTAILSDRDEQTLKALGIDATCDPEYVTTNLYNN